MDVAKLNRMISQIVVCVLLLNIEGLAMDPCQVHKFLPDAELRGQRCLLYDIKTALCDRLRDTGWYAVKYENVYLEMQNSCPTPFSCDTAAPIWLNGTHPTIADGIVDCELCVRGVHPHECCKTSIPAKIKNCGPFYVYKLSYTNTCDYAYCFGNHKCPAKLYPNATAAPPTGLLPSDPCLSSKPLQNADLRGSICTLHDVSNPICDRLHTTGWYNIKVNGKYQDMPTRCISGGSCGTSASIWLNGSLPVRQYEAVRRKACVAGYLPGECCKKSYDVMVKNCGSHNVYYLPYTDSCDEAYCFGNHKCILPSENTKEGILSKIIPMLVAIIVILVILMSIFVLIAWRFLCRSSKNGKVNTSISDKDPPPSPSAPPPYNK